MTTSESEEAKLLAEAERAFTRGDFAEVRVLTKRLSTSLDGEARAKARALLARVSVDPLAVGVWVVSLAFFLLVVFRYLGHDG